MTGFNPHFFSYKVGTGTLALPYDKEEWLVPGSLDQNPDHAGQVIPPRWGDWQFSSHRIVGESLTIPGSQRTLSQLGLPLLPLAVSQRLPEQSCDSLLQWPLMLEETKLSEVRMGLRLSQERRGQSQHAAHLPALRLGCE